MKEINGFCASPGLALGRIVTVERHYSASGRTVSAPGREAALFEAAALLAQDEIASLAHRAASEEGDIFIFQREILNDHGLLSTILRYIDAGEGAAAAVERAANLYAEKLRAVPDDYISHRAGDVLDACHRVVSILDGRPRERVHLKEPSILVSDELMPSDLVSLDKSLILGIAISAGSAQSHCSIIARTYGIPALVLCGEELLSLPAGMLCALDAGEGVLVAEPDEATIARFSHRISISHRVSMEAEKLRRTPCISKDGIQINLLGNCGGPQDIAAAIAAGAEGVGLLRSEFLFLGDRLPDEEEQFRFYRDCLLAAGGRPVTIRTLDIGADKSVAGVSESREENPALGLRGMRLSLAKPHLLHTQLAALLRAAIYGDLHIMFPMVTTAQDWDEAFAVLDQVREALTARGADFRAELPVGCMIETPAAALMAEELAPKVDFFSIGTNDLTQYTLAADRLNPAVARYFDPHAPALQKLIKMTLAAAEDAGIPVSVCGEAAAAPETALLYATLGVRKLSMAAVSISDVKLRLNDALIRSV